MICGRQTFGGWILQARKDKEYTQRKLAKLVGVNFTYLSKLENDKADYPPSVEVIKSLAQYLDLDWVELTFATGKISVEDAENLQALLKQYRGLIPLLLARLRDDDKFAKKVFGQLDARLLGDDS